MAYSAHQGILNEEVGTRMSSEHPPEEYCIQADAAAPMRLQRFASLLLLFAAAAAAAFGGLVAEDVFSGGNDVSVTHLLTLRTVMLIVSLALAGWATWILTIQKNNRGTLYYLRFQSETNPDFHEDVVEKARAEYLDFRSISAWCDPASNQDSDHRVVDVRRQVGGMSAELQRAANDDTGESGFDVAPNLIFPAALALGYDWTPPGRTTLRELNPPRQGHREVEQFQWLLPRGDVSGKGEISNKTKIFGRWIQHFDAESSASFRIAELDPPEELPTSLRSVWLEFRLTDHDYSGPTAGFTSDLKDKSDFKRIVGVEGPCSKGPNKHEAKRLKITSERLLYSGISVLEIAEAVAYWIARTLHDFPESTVFVAGAMPKSVSFAAGHLMTQTRAVSFNEENKSNPWFSDKSPGLYHPWQRIVPMGFFLYEENPPLRPMWVREDQVDPAILIKKAMDTLR